MIYEVTLTIDCLAAPDIIKHAYVVSSVDRDALLHALPAALRRFAAETVDEETLAVIDASVTPPVFIPWPDDDDDETWQSCACVVTINAPGWNLDRHPAELSALVSEHAIGDAAEIFGEL